MKTSKIIVLLFVAQIIFTSCNHPEKFTVNGWEVEIDNAKGTLSFAQAELGNTFNQVRFFLKTGENEKQLKHWSSVRENGIIKINTKNPTPNGRLKFPEQESIFPPRQPEL